MTEEGFSWDPMILSVLMRNLGLDGAKSSEIIKKNKRESKKYGSSEFQLH
jgi:hypothetical protein